MTLILWKIPSEQIKVIGGFFALVLPGIPFVSMIKTYFEVKNRDNKHNQ